MESDYIGVRIATFALFGVLLLAGSAVAAGGLSVSVDTKSKIKEGTAIDVFADVQADNTIRGSSAEANVSLFIDGEVVEQKAVTLERNESQRVTFSHGFTESGKRNVTVVAEYTVGNKRYSASDSTELVVKQKAASSSDSGTVDDEPSAFERCIEEAEESWLKSKFGCYRDYKTIGDYFGAIFS